jgi:acetyl/propionyl-CoA carboxylase alpha subunit
VAIARMTRALRELVVVGVPTSQSFHLRVLTDDVFRKGEADLTYFDQVAAGLLSAEPPMQTLRAAAVAAALLTDGRRAAAAAAAAATKPPPAVAAPAAASLWTQIARREGLR